MLFDVFLTFLLPIGIDFRTMQEGSAFALIGMHLVIQIFYLYFLSCLALRVLPVEKIKRFVEPTKLKVAVFFGLVGLSIFLFIAIGRNYASNPIYYPFFLLLLPFLSQTIATGLITGIILHFLPIVMLFTVLDVPYGKYALPLIISLLLQIVYLYVLSSIIAAIYGKLKKKRA